MKAYVDGRILEEDAAGLPSLRDRGLLYGDGLFETLRVRDGAVEFLDAHLARMAASAGELEIPIPIPVPELRGIVLEIARVNGGGSLALRVTLTRGTGGTRLDRDPSAPGRLLVTASALPAPAPRLAAGLALATAPFPRNERSPLARHKTLNYLEPILARLAARRAGADEALLLNTAGRVAEAAAANILLVRDDVLVTPPIEEGALPGIARAATLRAAASLGLDAAERPVEPAELFETPEVFLTSSLMGLVPIARLDGRPLPDSGAGKPWIPRLRVRVRELASEPDAGG